MCAYAVAIAEWLCCFASAGSVLQAMIAQSLNDIKDKTEAQQKIDAVLHLHLCQCCMLWR